MAGRRVVVADDEPLARERIRELLRAHPGFTIVAECEDGPAAMDAIVAHDPELRSFIDSLRRERSYAERFLVRGHQGLYFIRAEDVDWVDAQGNYVRLHALGKAHLVRDTMKAFEQKLDPQRFVRVNRSVIVNIDHIARAETHPHGEYALMLRDGAQVISSRAHGARLHQLLQ